MSQPTPSRALFTVSNHHTPHCGKPPAVEGDDPTTYHGYFENEHGEQALFLYTRESGEAWLWLGDAGWEKPSRVVEGRPEGLTLSPSEQTWLGACWRAAASWRAPTGTA
ncbi:MAG: hypothetical protein HY721_08185 [Planctomycetes bacterium]|nr:hypothetical protein [Planctomycetota bacterium]